MYQGTEADEIESGNQEDMMAGGKWIQAATAKMKQKGTIGAFGKATAKKIAAGKKAGGLQEKRAVFAANMKKIARKRANKS